MSEDPRATFYMLVDLDLDGQADMSAAEPDRYDTEAEAKAAMLERGNPQVIFECLPILLATSRLTVRNIRAKRP